MAVFEFLSQQGLILEEIMCDKGMPIEASLGFDWLRIKFERASEKQKLIDKLNKFRSPEVDPSLRIAV
jgi:hypothetical protein